jgi:hypothetical protein
MKLSMFSVLNPKCGLTQKISICTVCTRFCVGGSKSLAENQQGLIQRIKLIIAYNSLTSRFGTNIGNFIMGQTSGYHNVNLWEKDVNQHTDTNGNQKQRTSMLS